MHDCASRQPTTARQTHTSWLSSAASIASRCCGRNDALPNTAKLTRSMSGIASCSAVAGARHWARPSPPRLATPLLCEVFTMAELFVPGWSRSSGARIGAAGVVLAAEAAGHRRLKKLEMRP
eukprot:364197-Chlamydomonas_euryale.AAC.17